VPKHRIVFQYCATNEGSRKKPFTIIDESGFGRIHNVSQIHEDGAIYSITIFSEEDPEEILQILRSPSEGGVHVIILTADDHEIFRHPKFEKITSIDAKGRKKK